MSEKQNLDLVKRGYELFATGDVPGLLETAADDVEWRIGRGASEGVVPYAGTFRGRDGVMKFLQIYSENTENREFEPREFVAQGDKVIVFGHSKQTVKPTGKDYESDWVQVFTIRDGKTAVMDMYVDSAAAVAAWTQA